VFDGMGGAGGTIYETPDGQRSGAYLSSRIARDVAEVAMVDWLNSADDAGDADDADGNGAGEQAAQLLQQSVQQALQARLTELHAPTSRLRSKLLRALPTTMAMVAAQRPPEPGQMWNCDVLWAGDSRVYALDAAGLHQLTVDDIRDHGDAMANLREDSVVSNAMSADTPFVVNHRRVQLDEPLVLIAATDGCFGYLPSPMHFEHLLLSGLQDATTSTQWSDAVRTAITAVAGDDASMVVAVVGADLDALKLLTADRGQALRQRCIAPLDAVAAEIDRLAGELERARQRQAELSTELWTAYLPDYSRHLPTADRKDGIS
jgi:serine/threonine protein phosphatase PrpC